jgi:hypothetical protein
MVTKDVKLMYKYQFSNTLGDGIYVLKSKSSYDVVNIFIYFTRQTYSRVGNKIHFIQYKRIREGEENKDHSCLN